MIVLGTLYLVLVHSCKKDEAVPDLGYAYFPDNIGHWVIYQVDSTAKDDRAGVDTTYSFQLKEVIESYFTDNSGRQTMRIERYRKNYDPLVPYSQQSWVGPRVYYANLTRTTAERVEENIRYTRMVFPVKRTNRWNANANNTLEEWKSNYSAVDEAYSINAMNFDSVATVEESNDTSIVASKIAIAKYAKHVGLIYRKLILANKQLSSPQPPPPAWPFQDTIGFLPPSAYTLLSDKAIFYTQQILSWGN